MRKMAKRQLDTNIWIEPLVDDFTAEEKYFWLWLLTNPHNNLCGVCKIGFASIGKEMGVDKDTIVKLIDRFENTYNLIKVDKQTAEILNTKFKDYFWTSSGDIRNSIEKQIKTVDSKQFVDYINGEIEKIAWRNRGNT